MSSAVKTVFGGADDSAQKSQEKSNARSSEYTKEQASQARRDAFSLFPAAEENILAGGQAALDLLGGLVPQQVDAMRAGSSAARDAILGAGQGAVDFTPDYSILQQILPNLRNPDDRFGSASKIEGSPVYAAPDAVNLPDWLTGVKTNADLWRAASQGKIPGLSQSDQNFWGAHLANMQRKSSNVLDAMNWVNEPKKVSDRIVGAAGGFNPRNEARTDRLLNTIINPSSADVSPASKFLGGY